MRYLVLTVAALALSPTTAFAQQSAALASAANPVRIAAARTVIDKLWPLGTYRRLMDGTMSQMMDSMMDSMFNMRASDMLPEGADKTARTAAEGKSLGALAEQADPHVRERTRIVTSVMFAEMLPLIDRVEPTMRDSMVRIYARKFTPDQLGELDRFLSTPTGRAYASEWMTAFMDPEIVQGMQSFVPELVKAMPGILKKAEAATAHLPPPPKPKADDDA